MKNFAKMLKKHTIFGISYAVVRPKILSTILNFVGLKCYTVQIRVVHCTPPKHCIMFFDRRDNTGSVHTGIGSPPRCTFQPVCCRSFNLGCNCGLCVAARISIFSFKTNVHTTKKTFLIPHTNKKTKGVFNLHRA